jgi:hypothetical protein
MQVIHLMLLMVRSYLDSASLEDFYAVVSLLKSEGMIKLASVTSILKDVIEVQSLWI